MVKVEKKLYSKMQPGLTATQITEPDWSGRIVMLVNDPHHEAAGPDGEPFLAIGPPDEWSERELVPVPEGVPDVAYLVFYGKDPAFWRVEIAWSEREAQAMLETKGEEGFGFAPAFVARTQMTPRSDP